MRACIRQGINTEKVFIELTNSRPDDHNWAVCGYVKDEKNDTKLFDTVFDARRYCKEHDLEVLHVLVPRKRLNVIADVDFIPSLVQFITDAEQGLKAGKKEIDALREELERKLESYEMMTKSLNCMKEDHEELSLRKEFGEGIKEFGE